MACISRFGDTSPRDRRCGRSSYIAALRPLISSIKTLMCGDVASMRIGTEGSSGSFVPTITTSPPSAELRDYRHIRLIRNSVPHDVGEHRWNSREKDANAIRRIVRTLHDRDHARLAIGREWIDRHNLDLSDGPQSF